MRIHADVVRCQGYGNCVGIDDVHFDLDDDGMVLLVDPDVDADDAEVVQAAVRSCPVDAIWTTSE